MHQLRTEGELHGCMTGDALDIHISGLNGQTVYIYDLSGAAIATQTTDGTAAVKAGTYVIKGDNLSTKLLVK